MKKSSAVILIFLSLNLPGQNFECFVPEYGQELSLSLLPNKKVYFVGETHNIASNDLLDYQFVELLSKKYGLRTIIKEGSYSYIYFLNEYLQTGNENLLDTLSNSLGSFEEEQRAFLKRLYELNSIQVESEKIEIYSIDAESFFHIPTLVRYWEVKWGIPPNNVVSQTLKTLGSFKSSAFTLFPEPKDKKIIEKIVAEVKISLDANEKLFRDYLNDDFLHLKMIIENNATKRRNEKSMEDNFQLLHNLIGRDRYYFSYGKLHAQKRKGWLADRINKSEDFLNSVVSVKPIYKNSTFYWRGDELELNDYEEFNSEQKMKISSFECDESWMLIDSKAISDDKAFDFYIIASGQKGVTIIEN